MMELDEKLSEYQSYYTWMCVLKFITVHPLVARDISLVKWKLKPAGGARGELRVARIHPLGTIDIWAKFPGNPSKSFQGILWKTQKQKVQEGKSGYHHSFTGFVGCGTWSYKISRQFSNAMEMEQDKQVALEMMEKCKREREEGDKATEGRRRQEAIQREEEERRATEQKEGEMNKRPPEEREAAVAEGDAGGEGAS